VTVRKQARALVDGVALSTAAGEAGLGVFRQRDRHGAEATVVIEPALSSKPVRRNFAWFHRGTSFWRPIGDAPRRNTLWRDLVVSTGVSLAGYERAVRSPEVVSQRSLRESFGRERRITV
jgi:hypothetical protein